MAKAVFHRHQRVYVEPVGTWATIEQVKPVWVAGFEEPIRVTYDCGLGRDFRAEELTAETEIEAAPGDAPGHTPWRLMRARNRVQPVEDCAHHPYPGTYPVIVTDPNDWGGWRVPGAEYDRDPALIEMQARLITAAPRFFRLARELSEYVKSEGTTLPEPLVRLARRFEQLRRVIETPPPEAQARPAEAQAESEVGAAAAE
jgi:hypothetical protein